MKVEMAVLGSPYLPNSPYGLCGRKVTVRSSAIKCGSNQSGIKHLMVFVLCLSCLFLLLLFISFET